MKRAIAWSLFFALSLSMLTTCGSRLARRKAPLNKDATIEVDLGQVKFFDLVENRDVSIREYMNREDKEFLLLMFGSVGCSSCNAKAIKLTSDYLYSEPLFVGEQYKEFSMIGVNTDSGSNKLRFTQIWSDAEERHNSGYDFVYWQDPEGEMMKKFLLPAGVNFGVPYTIMLNKRGIVWFYLNNESYEIEELIARAKATIDGDVTQRPPPPKKPEEPTGPLPTLAGLALEEPGRLRGVSITTCKGETNELHALYGDSQVRFVQAVRDGCDATCAANLAALKVVADRCAAGSSARSCAAVTLAGQASCGASGDIAQGGKEFFSVFKTMFSWSYQPIRKPSSNIPIALPEVTGPLTLAFADSGRLLFAKEGAVTESELAAIVNTAPNQEIARPINADFQGLFGDIMTPGQPAYFDYPQWLARSRYSVLLTADPACQPCRDEVSHWQRRGDLYDYCAANPTFCQVGVIANETIYENTPEQLYTDKVEQWAEWNIVVPFFVESQLIEGGFSRFYEGFLRTFANWSDPKSENGNNGVAIYDQEGKVLYSFGAAEVDGNDLVFDTIKSLKK